MKPLVRNLEVGVRRLYIASWIIFVGLYWTNYVMNQTRHAAKPEAEFAQELVINAVITLVLPWAVGLMARWIYRGFVPKPVE